MSSEERLVRAHDLAVSAFLADTIYNFGELVGRCKHVFAFKKESTDVLCYLSQVDASNLGCVYRDGPGMDEKTFVYIQRRQHREIRSPGTAVPAGGTRTRCAVCVSCC
jgi:hypothetical protein